MIYSKFKATYDGNHDTFRVEFLVVPTAVLAFLVNHDFTPLEVTVFFTNYPAWYLFPLLLLIMLLCLNWWQHFSIQRTGATQYICHAGISCKYKKLPYTESDFWSIGLSTACSWQTAPLQGLRQRPVFPGTRNQRSFKHVTFSSDLGWPWLSAWLGDHQGKPRVATQGQAMAIHLRSSLDL